MGAFRLPPVDNLLRALPVLDVTDNRRLSLWVAFGLTAAGRVRDRRPRARGSYAAALGRRLGLGGRRAGCDRGR